MQQLVTSYQLVSHEDMLELRYNKRFDQDDIEQLAEVIMSKLDNVHLIEDVVGMDRVMYRLSVGDDVMQLHYEVYSQSCWIEIEGEDGKTVKKIAAFL